MNIQDRFLAYADDFETTYVDNDWSRIEPYFTADASYDSGLGEVAHGLPAVLAKLEGAVDGFDRLMDKRVLEFTPPTTEGDTVSTHWTARYSKAGAPDLQIGGTETARFEGDRIAYLQDVFDPGTEEAIADWMTQHGGSLTA